MKILTCWLGQTDLNASQGKIEGSGPICQALEDLDFDRGIILCDYDREKGEAYCRWLDDRVDADIQLMDGIELESPMDFDAVYRAAADAIETVLDDRDDDTDGTELAFHVSPGTPVMAAVWIILAKTRFPARLVNSSRESGGEWLDVPLNISAEYIAQLTEPADRRLVEAAQADTPDFAAFESIIHRCGPMKRLISRAKAVAPRHVPVLIQGESGTGKELLAKAIHNESRRRDEPFIPVNCGALPDNIVESELFGHEKGAFTGADEDRQGHFESADGGTLFLDEIGEMPPHIQVKVLRVLQERQIMRVGSSQTIDIDIRVVAATNRSLFQEVNDGQFREDLFHRLAVAILDLPPLRERDGDLAPVTDAILDEINEEFSTEDEEKELTPAARTALQNHHWPGNIRELRNTLLRAFIWSPDETIDEPTVRDALLTRDSDELPILHRPLDEDFDLLETLDEVKEHYIRRALQQTGGTKTRAAELIGFDNHQRLTGWMEKLGLDS